MPGASEADFQALQTDTTQDLNTKTNWPEIGLAFADLGCFKIATDEENPGGLTFAHPLVVLRLEHSDKEDRADGPTVTILVEDIAQEYMSCPEYCNKTRQLAIDPDMGFPMPPEMKPKITREGAVGMGKFECVLEYEQAVPTASMKATKTMRIANYFTVSDGFAYVMQFTCELGDYGRYVEGFEKLASGVSISPPLPRNSQAVTQVSNWDLKVRVDVPVFWTPTEPPTKGPIDGVSCLARFHTNSELKSDMVIVGASGSLKGGELAEKLVAAKEGSEGPCEEGGAYKIESKNGDKQVVTYVKDHVFLEVTANGKDTVSTVPRGVVDTILASVSDQPNASDLMVECQSLKCRFERPMGSQLGAQRLGYPLLTGNLRALEGGRENKAVFAISRPSPEPGKVTPTDASQWMAKLDEELGDTVVGKALKYINGFQCVSVDCEEMAPRPDLLGQEEQKSRMNIYVVEGSTVLVRVDCLKDQWPRFEQSFNTVSESVTFY